MTYRHLLALIFLTAFAAAASAQPMMPPPQPRPVPTATPLLPVRFLGPQGLRATFYQGRPEGREFEAPVTVGMRSGYVYRVKLGGMAKYPGVNLYPTLEVRGNLQLPPRMNPADYPAPVVLTDDDVEKALDGVLITKVVYLENPNRAASLSWKPDEPPEQTLPPTEDPWAEAWNLGRPVLIVRFGERQVSPEELAACSLAGTILMPGERVLPAPRYPPCLPLATKAFFDPTAGPRVPEEDCLHDGGDHGIRAGHDAAGRLLGLDPEDTVAEYTDARGRRNIACSNRICICVPRFAVLRTEVGLLRTTLAVGVGDTRMTSVQGQLQARLVSLQNRKYEQIQGLHGRERPSAAVNKEGLIGLARVEVLAAQEVSLGIAFTFDRFSVARLTEVQKVQFRRQVEFARQLTQHEGLSGFEQKIGTAVVGRVVGGPEVVTAEVETRDFTVCCCQPEVQAPDKPLSLCKWADRDAAQVGDVVTIFLRYTNHGGKPITDVAVSDSLTTRLEYVPGSAQSDRDAVFTTQPNEAGSLVLRWEISGTLQPGQSGVVRFQMKVR
jgi:uncharacterized repeat protein (TIGR01451 family)